MSTDAGQILSERQPLEPQVDKDVDSRGPRKGRSQQGRPGAVPKPRVATGEIFCKNHSEVLARQPRQNSAIGAIVKRSNVSFKPITTFKSTLKKAKVAVPIFSSVSLGLTDYFQVDMLGLRYTSVIFGAKKCLESTILVTPRRLRELLVCCDPASSLTTPGPSTW